MIKDSYAIFFDLTLSKIKYKKNQNSDDLLRGENKYHRLK